jgi:hypothetical protein
MARNEAKSGAATLHCAGAWRAMTSRKGRQVIVLLGKNILGRTNRLNSSFA